MDSTKEVVDLNSFLLIEEFCFNKINFRFKNGKYKFPIALDVTSQYFVINDDTLNIHVFASTRNDLMAELIEQIYVLWKEYALEEDNVLTREAKNIKVNLIKHIETILVS